MQYRYKMLQFMKTDLKQFTMEEELVFVIKAFKISNLREVGISASTWFWAPTQSSINNAYREVYTNTWKNKVEKL